MVNKLVLSVLVVFVTACSATQPAPYQADREPEDRDTYNGMEGLAQYQKDQRYLLNKELTDKCAEAKVDLAVAEKNGNIDAVKDQQLIIDTACRE